MCSLRAPKALSHRSAPPATSVYTLGTGEAEALRLRFSYRRKSAVVLWLGKLHVEHKGRAPGTVSSNGYVDLPLGVHLLGAGAEGVDARLAAANPARASSASSLRTRAYPFRPMHLRAPSSTAPLSRLALQRPMSVSPFFSSAGSFRILRPSVRTQAISGLLVAHPE